MELLQVVLACEAQFGITFEPAEDLLGDGLETLGTLAGVIRRRSRRSPAPRRHPKCRRSPEALTSSAAESRPWGLARLRVRWRARPPYHSRPVWALLIVLDVLPWPWGEDILAGLFTVVGLARPSRRRAALAWAEALAAARPWRLAAKLCAFRGRWVARTRLLGIRRPDDLRQNLIVEGAEHLTAVSGAAIILGFHLGPPSGDLIFRVLGYPVTFLGGTRSKRGDRMVERCVAPLRGGESALVRGRRSEPVAGRSLRRPTNAPRRREDLHPGRRRRRGSIPSPLVRRRLAHPSRMADASSTHRRSRPAGPPSSRGTSARHDHSPASAGASVGPADGPRGLAGQLDASPGRLREAIPRAVPFPGLAHALDEVMNNPWAGRRGGDRRRACHGRAVRGTMTRP